MSERKPEQPIEQDDAPEDEPDDHPELEPEDQPERSVPAAVAEQASEVDLAELGRRYAVAGAVTQELRDGFRELKRHPADAKRLTALLRGLARKHEPEARRAVEQITRAIESIQAPAETG